MLARLALLVLVPAVLAAQAIDDQLPVSQVPSRLAFGLHAIGTRPVGDFGRAVNDAWGAGAEVRVAVDPAGWLAVRLDGGYSAYGRNRRAIAAVGGGDILGVPVNQLVSDNTMATMMIGAELAVPAGAVRPYVHAMAGGSYFQTTTRVESPGNALADGTVATNLEDWVGSGAVGGGVRLQLARNRTGTTLTRPRGASLVHGADALRHRRPAARRPRGSRAGAPLADRRVGVHGRLLLRTALSAGARTVPRSARPAPVSRSRAAGARA